MSTTDFGIAISRLRMDIDTSPRRLRTLPEALRRPMLKAGLRCIGPLNRLVRLSAHGRDEIFPRAFVPWMDAFERDWQQVRAELDLVMADLPRVPSAHEAYAGQEAISMDDRWKTYVLCRGSGGWHVENLRACPRTHLLLQGVPGLEHAMFSVLAPGKEIKPHVGPYAGVIDCHLGLRVPRDGDNCRLRVGGSTVSWREGSMFAFDDTMEHEVWNHTDDYRAVLLLYVKRPLPFPLNLMNQGLMRYLERVL